MLAQIPIALEELRQMLKASSKNNTCVICIEALPIVESMITTISGQSGSLASGLSQMAKAKEVKS